MDQQEDKKTINDYSFEVYWKDELSASVSVKGGRVMVNRIIIDPVRQLFAKNEMSRDQLNRILSLRCIDKDRPDLMDKLKHMGIDSYNPLAIVKKTHGVSYNDYLWFKFPGETICSKDVLVKDDSHV